MFSTDLIESKQERVAINGVEPQMIGMLVSYAYTSEVYISKANVQVRHRVVFLTFLKRAYTCFIMRATGPSGSSQPVGRDGSTRGLLSFYGASDG